VLSFQDVSNPAIPGNERNNQLTQYAVAALLLLLFLVSPWYIWPAFLVVSAAFMRKTPVILVVLTIVSLSFMVASRHVGYLWGPSDDVASYYLAYDNYSDFWSVMPIALVYTYNADILFAYFSYGVARLTDNHRFIYFFLTVAISFMAYAFMARKYTKSSYVLFCLVCYIIFSRSFIMQWMLLRVCMAMPFFFMAVYENSNGNRKKGIFLFLIGFFLHGSTAIIFFPLMVAGKYLKDKVSVGMLLKYGSMAAIVGSAVVAVLFMTNAYLLNKITSQNIEVSMGSPETYAITLMVGIAILIQSKDAFMKNLIIYFLIFGFLGFFFGKNVLRFTHPLLFLLPIMIVHLVEVLKDKHNFAIVFRPVWAVFCFMTFMHALNLNYPDFYYKAETDPRTITGYQQAQLFVEYIRDDVEYYDGWRTR